MQTAIILGKARATVKDISLTGQRLVVLQPIGVNDTADGPPLLAIDPMGARKGDHVIITSDGSYVQEFLGHENTPARWTVMGLVDPSN